jgi:predicted short-subunit dehydrogenase-like oxidoreductase (DUF2520 family)
MIKVSIIGSGNVAQHLISSFLKSDEIELVQVYSRSKFHLDSVCVTNDLVNLLPADIYIISVSDDAIASISTQLAFQNKLVVHTSGSVSINAIDAKNRQGVFYPLQTFSKNKPVDFTNIPICIETQHEADYDLLEKTARSISVQLFAIDSLQRKALHVSAVFANNFTNHLYKIASDICKENNIPFEILKPLIHETAEKLMTLSPAEAQTGPAKRNDNLTIEAHLAFLKNENQKNIYKVLTQSIQKHGEEL